MCSTRDPARRNAARCAPSPLRPAARLAVALAVSAGLAVAGGGGCQTNPAPAPEPVSLEALPVDEAMQRRDWPQSVAEFKVGATEAGATRFPYAPQTSGDGAGWAAFGPERSNALLDNVFFLAQAVALPFTYFVDPPMTKKTYRGVIYDPTYTAVPVLPPDEAPAEGASEPLPPPPPADAETDADLAPEADQTTIESMRPATRRTDESTIESMREPAPLPPGHVAPGETPVEALPRTIAPGVSEPAPAEPQLQAEPQPAPAEPEATPAPMPEATEPAPEATEPAPEATTPAPDATAEPVPATESTEAAPEATVPAPEPAAEPAPAEPEPAPAEPEPAPADPGADANK